MTSTRPTRTGRDRDTPQPCWCLRTGPDHPPTDVPAMHCLVVDHLPAHRDRLARLLTARACVGRVTCVADPMDGLRVIGRTRVDVAFVEARMPSAGPELAWVLHRLRDAPAVVLVTDSRYRGTEAPDALGHLSRSARPDELTGALRWARASRAPGGTTPCGNADSGPPADPVGPF
jgi:hypothetical protein